MTGITSLPSFPFDFHPGLEMEPEYARMRETAPVCRVRLPYGGDAWLVTRYADVRQVLVDTRFSRARACTPDGPRITAVIPPDSSIMSMDPPHHTRLRGVLAGHFTARRVAKLRTFTEHIVTRLLDEMVDGARPADFVTSVALPLPALVVGELFGISESERDKFKDWAKALLGISAATTDDAMSALAALADLFRSMIAARRENPTDDVIGALVAAHDDQGRLTDDEMVMTGVTLLVAGFESTADQIANSVYLLLATGQYGRLRDDPGLVPSAVEELVRYIPLGTASGLPYAATADVELGGVHIRAGDTVVVSFVSANRDMDAFAEADRLDLGRSPNPHVGFGHGVHHCLGAQLARMELGVLLSELPRRLPTLSLAVPANQMHWKEGMLTRGLVSLPVVWSE
jgi:cytochrome P450